MSSRAWCRWTGERFHLERRGAVAACDENTIGVVAVLGSTFDGSYEPVAEIAAALDKLAADGGPDIPVHVDGASGGMVAPFLDPDLAGTSGCARVASINTSGHKYGLVYPGVGWVLWRDSRPARGTGLQGQLPGRQHAHLRAELLPARRRGGGPVLQLLAAGPRGVHRGPAGVPRRRHVAVGADRRAGRVPAAHQGRRAAGVRVHHLRHVTDWDVFEVSAALRERGWQVPAYTFPENREDLAVLRVVVRNGFSLDLADLFFRDLLSAVTGHERGPARPS